MVDVPARYRVRYRYNGIAFAWFVSIADAKDFLSTQADLYEIEEL